MSHGFTIDRRDQSCVITLQTDLTAALVASLQAAVRQALSEDVKQVDVDLDKATMLDSSGIGFLIAMANTLSRSGGHISVVNVSKDIRNLLHSMRLTARLDVREKT